MNHHRSIISRLVAVGLAIVVTASACSDGDDGPSLETSSDPTATPEPTATSQPDGTPRPTSDSSDTADDGEPDEGDAEDSTPSATPDPDIDLGKPAFTESSKVSTVGLDEVYFGMTADEAAAAAGTAWESDGPVTDQCWFATPVNGPVGVTFMIWNGSVERLEVTTELITTRSGAGVGSTTDELRELFGDLLDETDPELLAFVPTDEGDAEFRIFFTMEGGVATSYRAGRLPMVEFPTCP